MFEERARPLSSPSTRLGSSAFVFSLVSLMYRSPILSKTLGEFHANRLIALTHRCLWIVGNRENVRGLMIPPLSANSPNITHPKRAREGRVEGEKRSPLLDRRTTDSYQVRGHPSPTAGSIDFSRKAGKRISRRSFRLDKSPLDRCLLRRTRTVAPAYRSSALLGGKNWATTKHQAFCKGIDWGWKAQTGARGSRPGEK